MTASKLFRRLAAAAAVLAVGGAAAVLLDGVANADPPAGTLGSGSLTITATTADPIDGTDLSIPTLTTPTGCPDTANSFQVETTGPNGFDYFSDGTQSTNLSHTGPFSIEFESNMKDASSTIGVPLVAGEYDVDMRCIDDGTLQSFGDFTGALIFSDPTHFTVFGASPGPSSNPSSSSNPSPSSSPSLSPTSSPTATPTDTTSDSLTTAPPTSTTDIVGTNTTSDTGGGTQTTATTGGLANTGAPIAILFLGGLILLAVGLMLVVWVQRRRSRL